MDELTEMVEKFQCPGCASGSDTECGKFKPYSADGFCCENHCMGTMVATSVAGIVTFALGLPKGFCRKGFERIRLYTKMPTDVWNHLNIPVWVLEQNGYLFVKTYSPRICLTFIDIIKGGKSSDINTMADATAGKSHLQQFKPINISEFIGEID